MKYLCIITLLLTGCATMFSPKSAVVHFDTTPTGQTIHVRDRSYVTPATVTLSTREEHVVTWPDGTTQVVGGRFQPLYLLNALNIIGFIVDAGTNAAYWNIDPVLYYWKE